MKRSTVTCMLWLGTAAALAAQQSAHDIEMLNRYAGTWAVDCAKSPGTRLTVGPASLALAADGKQLHTAAPLAAFSYYGNAQPPIGFEFALLGEGSPTGLTLLAMEDEAGRYLSIDADTPLQKQFGKPALAGKFRHCP